jgi:hypothetical protein
MRFPNTIGFDSLPHPNVERMILEKNYIIEFKVMTRRINVKVLTNNFINVYSIF